MGDLLFSFLYKFLRRWIRQSQLIRYARSRGYSFSAKNLADAVSFSMNVFSRVPSKEYKVSRAANIIQGNISGLRFTYFEKTLLEVSEDAAEEPVATRSIVSIVNFGDECFESELAFEKDLPFYRENGGICFWWNDASSDSKAIPVNRLDQWLAEIASTFRAGVSKPAPARQGA